MNEIVKRVLNTKIGAAPFELQHFLFSGDQDHLNSRWIPDGWLRFNPPSFRQLPEKFTLVF